VFHSSILVCSGVSVDRKFRVRRNKVTAQPAAATMSLEQRLNSESGHDSRYLQGNKHATRESGENIGAEWVGRSQPGGSL
jgi:hypothetical protein